MSVLNQRNSVASIPLEMECDVDDASTDAAESASALHERLVAYVHAVAGAPDTRAGVWVEHSYARARDAAAAGRARELLAPGAPPERDRDRGDVDVERLEPPPPRLAPEPEPEPAAADSGPDSDDDSDDWEARVAALAPGAAHARLAAAAADALRRLRLARLAGRGDGAVREQARRLRLALAPLWAWPGPPQRRPPAWLHAALLARLPRRQRRAYDELLAELRRTVPRLAERMPLAGGPPPARDPLAAVAPPVGPDAGPWLVWLSCDEDERWPRRLRALLHTRCVRAPPSVARPERWCGAAAGALRGALRAALAAAGARPALLGGAGAGASLCAWLAGAEAGARGLLLLAPPLQSAEGGAALGGLRAPALLVAGAGAAQSWRGAARDAAAAPGRRLLLVAGADERLRLPAAHRRRLRLPQHALDAAIAEECARWALEVAEEAAAAEPLQYDPVNTS
ncbi:uncharacterized protein ACR2FA_008650 [Aphomia sociella]